MKRISLCIVMVLSIIFILGCEALEDTKNVGYYSIGSEAELKKILDEEDLYYNIYPEVVEDAVGSNSKNTSSTNVRTEGIDEGDIVKVDDIYIYYINQNTLYVIDHQTNTVVLNETLSEEQYYSYFSELYIIGSYLVVIGQRFGYNMMPYEMDGSVQTLDYFWFRSEQTIIYVYDISTLSLEDSYVLPGYLTTSRQKDDTLYFMSNQYVYNSDDVDPRPIFKVNEEEIIPAYESIKTHEQIDKQAYTIFTALQFSDDIQFDYEILLGPGYFYTTYFSDELLFLSTYQYTYDEVSGYQSNGLIMAYDYTSGFDFVGYGLFYGHIINDYAIDYYDQHLRLVTTEGFGDNVKNRLYILKEENNVYQTVSLLEEGIGKPRETVRSVLFNENEVTVVTFEQIDPFYVIDVSNVKEPVITQSIEISGFSLYQHTWAPDIVLGIGFEVENNRTTGIKLALYDKRADLNIIGMPLILSNQENSYQFSEALYNRKAMLFDIERGFFGFTVYKSFWDEYQYSQVVEYLIFGVNLDSNTPITIKKAIDHDFGGSDIYYHNIDRAVYVDDYLFVLSGLGVTVHDINQDFIEIDQILFT